MIVVLFTLIIVLAGCGTYIPHCYLCQKELESPKYNEIVIDVIHYPICDSCFNDPIVQKVIEGDEQSRDKFIHYYEPKQYVIK